MAKRRIPQVGMYKDGVLVKVFNGLAPAAKYMGTYGSRISYAILRKENLRGYTFKILENNK